MSSEANKAAKQARKAFFQGNKTRPDEITGALLHADQQAAINKYGKTHAPKHTADADHIIAQSRARKRLILRRNPFLTAEAKEAIIHNPSNLQVMASSLNRSKQDETNLKLALDFTKKRTPAVRLRLVGLQARAELHMAKNIATQTAKNVGVEYAAGARHSLEAAAISLMTEGVQNLYLVAAGEKNLEEASRSMAKLTAEVAVSGGAMRVAAIGADQLLKQSSSAMLQKLAHSNQVANLVAMAAVVKDSVFRFVSGELDGEQFFREIAQKGGTHMASLAGAAIGQALIPIPGVGMILGSLIVSTACGEIIRTCESLRQHQEKRKRVERLASRALAEMERQRTILIDLSRHHFAQWDESVRHGFEQLARASVAHDVAGVAQGLDQILTVVGQKVPFRTLAEFDEVFLDPHAELKL